MQNVFSYFFSLKRLQSTGITVGSYAIAALIATVGSTAWVAFTGDLQGWLAAAGVPISVTAVLGKFIDEFWRAWLNAREAAKTLSATAMSRGKKVENW